MRLDVKGIAAILSAFLLASCARLNPMDYLTHGADRATDRAVDTAADRTGQRVGETVGDSMGNAAAARVGASMNPMMTQFYMQLVFAMAFNQGGYAVNEGAYRPGEWTRWSIPNRSSRKDEAKESTLERAYLFDDRDGNAWWKVKWTLDPAKASESTLVVEALFDKRSYSLLRMRSKMPNETEGKEVPVTEATYYVPPQRLTKQSLEGATKGVVRVSVPAGSFGARHVVFGDAAGGTAEWFLADKVPGGSVKFVHSGPRQGRDDGADPANYTMELAGYGSGARSELGVTR